MMRCLWEQLFKNQGVLSFIYGVYVCSSFEYQIHHLEEEEAA